MKVTFRLEKESERMNEYRPENGLRSSLIKSGVQRVRQSKPSSHLYLAVAVAAAASTLGAANLAELHSRAKRILPEPRTVAQTDASTGSTTFNTDQGPGPGPIGPGPGCNLLPAPASVGAAVNLSYFGPPPSESPARADRLIPCGRAPLRCRSIRDQWRAARRPFGTS